MADASLVPRSAEEQLFRELTNGVAEVVNPRDGDLLHQQCPDQPWRGIRPIPRNVRLV